MIKSEVENPFLVERRAMSERKKKGVEQALANFELPDFIEKVYYDDWVGDHMLVIDYNKKSSEVFGNKRREFHKRLADKLAEHNLELSSRSDNGAVRELFRLNELTVDGGTNWRRWLNYPHNFSEEVKMLLDEAALGVGQQKGFDRYQKFYFFLYEARDMGLLSPEEVKHIEIHMYDVVNP